MNTNKLLRERQREPEAMDAPELPEAPLYEALDALGAVSSLSRTAPLLWRSITTELKTDLRARSRPLRVLDVATGGGNVPIALWQIARRANVPVEIHACDVNPAVLRYARALAARRSAAVTFFEAGASSLSTLEPYDVVVSSLFLHHLEHGPAVDFLRDAAQCATKLLLVSDLERSLRGLLLARLATTALTRSKVAREDGLRSVRGAFTREEVSDLAAQAGLRGATIRRTWPLRILLTYRP